MSGYRCFIRVNKWVTAAYTEINAEDVSSLEKLQSDILDWMESYESLSQEYPAMLTEISGMED
jgi:hypothetical protein